MEKDRTIRPIGNDKVRCTKCCAGKFSLTNSEGKEVCNVFDAPAKQGELVNRFTLPDEMRICILLNPEKT